MSGGRGGVPRPDLAPAPGSPQEGCTRLTTIRASLAAVCVFIVPVTPANQLDIYSALV